MKLLCRIYLCFYEFLKKSINLTYNEDRTHILLKSVINQLINYKYSDVAKQIYQHITKEQNDPEKQLTLLYA